LDSQTIGKISPYGDRRTLKPPFPLLLSQQFLADFADTFKNFSEGIGIFMLLHHIYVGMNEKVVEIFGCFVIICLSLQLIWQNSIVCTITINA
jgi:hypothetical protein